MPVPNRLIPIDEVEEIMGICRAHVYALIQQKKFILPVKIGRSSRWPLDGVLAWVEQRIAERDAARKS